MKISLIIPMYNESSIIHEALDTFSSYMAETFEDWELIFVDDGSADGIRDILTAYTDRYPNIRAVYKENGGVTSARLRGVEEARGDWIAFMDGDDAADPRMYGRLLENALNHDADISHCGHQLVFPDGRVEYVHKSENLFTQDHNTGLQDLLDNRKVSLSLCTKLYRRELFDGLDAWMDRTVRINEDLLMNFYLFRQVRTAVFEDICPYHYVLRKGSASTSRLNAHKLQDPLKVLYLLLDETADVPEWKQIVERRLIYQLVGSATISIGQQRELILPCRKAARRELRKQIWGVMVGTACPVKLKVMALWAAVWPASYSWVHNMYAKISGIDKKFEVR